MWPSWRPRSTRPTPAPAATPTSPPSTPTTTCRPSRPTASSCHEKQSESYGASVHGLALAKGRKDAATCSDCHDGHTILPPTSPASPAALLPAGRDLRRAATTRRPRTSRKASTAKRWPPAIARRPPAPIAIRSTRSTALKSGSPLKISVEVCSQCHASERLNTKYNLPPDRVKTFFESYHGLAAQYGSTAGRQLRQLPRRPQDPALHRPALQHLQNQPGGDLRQVPSGRDRELRPKQGARGRRAPPGRRRRGRARSIGGCGASTWC